MITFNKIRPLMLSVETTNQCNSECFFCPIKKQKRAIGSMSYELFAKICQEYDKEQGGYLSLTPSVGEFFLDNLWRERIEIAKQYKSINTTVTTNAHVISSLSNTDILRISESFNKISISFYGLNEDEHKYITHKNFHSKAILGLKKLLNFYPSKNIEIGFRLADSISKDVLKLWIIEKFGEEINFHSNHLYNNWNYIPIETKFHISNQSKASLCGLPLISFRIYYDGKMSLCPCAYTFNSPSFLLGNVTDNQLSDLFGFGMQKIHNALLKNEFYDCKNCSIRIEVDEVCNEFKLKDYPPYYFGG